MAALKSHLRRRRRRHMKRKARGAVYDEFWDVDLSPLERREILFQRQIEWTSLYASMTPRDRRNRLRLLKRQLKRFMEAHGEELERERTEWDHKRAGMMRALEESARAARSLTSTVVVGFQTLPVQRRVRQRILCKDCATLIEGSRRCPRCGSLNPPPAPAAAVRSRADFSTHLKTEDLRESRHTP